ncbi:MAG: FtsW/RodA/SpoVE family cell cycle protein [Clostridia bacterium]|nr:FtsW/RodA/SpoVE family cell cycle protein [Clostridia bacterium]
MSILTLAGAANASAAGPRRVVIQIAASLVGLVMAYIISLFDYDELLNHFTLPLLGIGVGLMILTVIFGVGPDETSTNKCWLSIPGLPFDIQPAEFVKIVFIMTFAKHIDIVKKKINHPLVVLSLCIHGGLITGLVLLTGDLGSALVYLAIMAIMLYTGGLSLWYFAAALAVVIVLFPYLWPKLSEYQQQRILVGFNPELDPIKYGYQALRSRDAIAAGGFFGAGFSGGSYFKLVPEYKSDFLFAVVAEKFGFIGTFFYMALMGTLIFRLIWIARHARKDCGANICMGVAAIMLVQSLENIGMCLGMLPVVGITLPFLSYGGSSMLASFIYIGVIQSIVTHNQKYYFERENA